MTSEWEGVLKESLSGGLSFSNLFRCGDIPGRGWAILDGRPRESEWFICVWKRESLQIDAHFG